SVVKENPLWRSQEERRAINPGPGDKRSLNEAVRDRKTYLSPIQCKSQETRGPSRGRPVDRRDQAPAGRSRGADRGAGRVAEGWPQAASPLAGILDENGAWSTDRSSGSSAKPSRRWSSRSKKTGP